jgi:hypothetical protein
VSLRVSEDVAVQQQQIS